MFPTVLGLGLEHGHVATFWLLLYSKRVYAGLVAPDFLWLRHMGLRFVVKVLCLGSVFHTAVKEIDLIMHAVLNKDHMGVCLVGAPNRNTYDIPVHQK